MLPWILSNFDGFHGSVDHVDEMTIYEPITEWPLPTVLRETTQRLEQFTPQNASVS